VRKARIAGGGVAVVLAGVGLAWLPAAAQDGGPGPRMTFGLSQSLRYDDNLDLDVDSLGSTVQSITGLSFGLSSQTGISSLALSASTGLRILDGPDDADPDGGNTTDVDLDNTRIGLSYGRATANAALDVTGTYSMQQIENALTLADFDPGTGVGVEVPEDLGQLAGTGQRRFYGLNAGLSLGLQDPVGYRLTAGFSGLDYANTSDPSLFGNTRATVGAALLLRLSPVDQGRIGLSWGNFTSDDPDNEDSDNVNLDLGVTRTLPNGNVGFTIFAEDSSDEGDSRSGFSLSRALTLPEGSLSASIGATRLEDQDPEFTGALSWRQNLPDGAINLGLTQAVQNDSDNVPQYVTGLRFGYDRDLTPLSRIGLGASYAVVEAADSPDRTETASLTAVYSRDVTEDWALDLGYTYRQREEDDAGMARSNAVFLGLRRSWELRP
jgi:hypothetical protein